MEYISTLLRTKYQEVVQALLGMDGVTLVALGAAAAAVFYYCRSRWRLRKFPPGPRGVPFIGNGPQMDKLRPQLTLTEWGKQYNGLYTLHLLNKTIIVAGSYDVIREVLVTKSTDFAGRPSAFRMHFLNHFDEDNFSFGDYSPRLMRLKKIAQTSMKMYGDGLMKLEEISMEIIGDLLTQIDEFKGQPFNPRNLLKAATTNIITSMVAGHKMETKDIEFFLSKEPEAKKLMNPVGKGMLLDLLPWLRYFPNETFRKLQILRQDYSYLFRKIINSRQGHLEENATECFLDGILQRKERGEVDTEGRPLFTDQNIMVMVQDIVIAGMATTSGAIYTLLGLCATCPDLQKRIQTEIEDVIGERTPSLGDRGALPYTEACLLEILRYMSHVPTLLPHKATKDTTLSGYSLPKGTVVWVNVWALHHDEEFWDEPNKFKPERYLDRFGNLVGPDHPTRRRTLPFGAGRRVCFGETLARNRLFLFVVALLQKYTFVPAEGDPAPQCDPRTFPLQFILRPPDFRLQAAQRHAEE